jgi:hypothetical protein
MKDVPLHGYLPEEEQRGLYMRDHPPKLRPVEAKPDMVEDPELGRSRPTNAEVILRMIPDGFIHDMVGATRGVESPTDFCIWSGFFAVSCALQRRAWAWDKPYEIFPNLFLIYMAPPGVCKKSTTIKLATKVIRGLPRLFEEQGDKELFTMPIHDGSVTPEGMFDLLQPRTTTIYEEGSSSPISVPLGSRLALIVDELASFLGRQKYNSGAIARLINLYDCKDSDSAYTKKDKMQAMENVYFNLFAGTTPNGFQESIPEEAHGGGFLSRVILVRQDEPTRIFPKPFIPKGACSLPELSRRLGWISMYKGGHYTLDSEADEMYEKWYVDQKNAFKEGGMFFGDDGNVRMDLMLMKLAMMIRAQAYDDSTVISGRDMAAAIQLIEEIGQAKRSVYSLITPNDWTKKVEMVVKRLKGKPDGVSRQRIAGWTSRDFPTRDLDQILSSLKTAGKIEILLDEQPVNKVHGISREVYVWKS